ncbi:hypothetical protein SAMN02745121_04046 [Nannocystis exedens]|uniref:Uncharacterized protein n=1 Tax=Nannocystis exedens TaxID=54 RepID=A0A1I1ZZD7_9BACT|nr:hypothetical protein [Nannocystis exedens]PCC75231.1 hypothetical protein NAEX_08340 [Nannocystis exedens]SFE36728.1 hypothetical protein SAMN02745121_04046 [Nannocystis exedens]
MRSMILHAFAIGLVAAPMVAHAAPAAIEASESAADRRTPNERILGALTLPLKAQALRKAGVGEGEVKAGLKAAKDKKLPAGDAAEVLDEAAKATRDHGPVDNFGAFVQAKLDAGLRGRDLAAAIREEHAARGKGKGKSEGKGPPEGKGPEAKSDGPPHGGPADDKGPEGKGPEGKGPDGKGPDGKGPDDKGPPGQDAAEGKAPGDKGPNGAGAAEGKAPGDKEPPGKAGAEGKAPDDKGSGNAKNGKANEKAKPETAGK